MLIALLPYSLIIISFGLAIWAKSLYLPIHQFSVGNVVEGVIFRFFNSGVEGSVNSNLMWNLIVPGIMFLFASTLLLAAAYLLLRQVILSAELSLDNILKGSIMGLAVFMMVLFLFNGGKLLFLTFLSFTMLLFIPIFLVAILNHQKRAY
ncbi:hypothetical protein [Ornithinibacillus halotolerans]|uniref:Uncharacterized protein n=1 Tax=Ornithinibacillus halotolerans TaxID=1274357 RepID=A0A916SBR0_9BACI|nr:hypothetical protein [Ornithinibacillus halotolerans]GGA92787.1 hypothetical protein GCM10008025_39020 [Ornithinibacillus halotolerans]